MMKFICFILISQLVTSCCIFPDMCRPTTLEYTMINDTQHQILIKPFAREKTINPDDISMATFSGNFETAEPIFLAPSEIRKSVSPATNSTLFFSISLVDSVRVIFDDKKIIIYTCTGLSETCTDRILLGSSTYTFTESEYQSAEECDGKCE